MLLRHASDQSLRNTVLQTALEGHLASLLGLERRHKSNSSEVTWESADVSFGAPTLAANGDVTGLLCIAALALLLLFLAGYVVYKDVQRRSSQGGLDPESPLTLAEYVVWTLLTVAMVACGVFLAFRLLRGRALIIMIAFLVLGLLIWFIVHKARQAAEAPPTSQDSQGSVAPIEQRLIDILGTVAVPDEFRCPITREIMAEPVIAEDGYTYERSAVVAWFRSRRTSPVTNVQLPSTHLVPNFNVRSQIIAAAEEAAASVA
eukprot:TRINITY_DN7390_c0_g1_i1.p1 TRINITY_DN7390_c0_g1~~TRINITY_DN7390_c0_g1_i1.p1  ORF type:complete len:261 (-),score=33.89 TRINITY_DN7390_c0_g1_i1:260-1042(-)